MKDFITLTTFTKLTDFKERTVRTWCKRGRLKAVQPAGNYGQWYIHNSELEKYRPKQPI